MTVRRQGQRHRFEMSAFKTEPYAKSELRSELVKMLRDGEGRGKEKRERDLGSVSGDGQ